MSISSLVHRIKQFPNSLSRKLIFLFLIIALLFLVVVGASLGHFVKHYFQHQIKPHFFQYMEYVRNDIGFPANHQKAQQLADKLNIDIVIINNSNIWSSNGENLHIGTLNIEHEYVKNGVSYGEAEIDDKDYAIMTEGDTHFLFDLSRIKHERRSPRGLMPLAFLLIILFILYYATRKLFAPILTIQQGIHKIGEGDLQHRIITTRKDELGELASNINNMAKELQKMLDAKRQLLLAVSHELRSPLTRTNVALEILEDSNIKQRIKEDIQEMESLITDILEAERLNTQHSVLNKKVHSINILCQELVNHHFAHDTLTVNLPNNNITANVDGPRIKLLLKNTIANALRYQSQLTRITLSNSTDTFTIEIEDDGCGISADDIPYLTEPFYRVDPARQRQTGGYGLGLYLCKVVAEAHGGVLSIESQLDQGTKISITLPLQNI